MLQCKTSVSTDEPRRLPRRQRGLVAVAGVLLALTSLCGCGQKGPLYRPDDKAQAVNSAVRGATAAKKKSLPLPAPQSQKKERPPAASDPATQPDPAQPTPPPGT